MAEVEKEYTPEQVQLAERLKNEMPRIESGVKGYLSLKMAESYTENAAQRSSSAGVAAAMLQGCARVLLQTLNALDMPPVVEWGAQHPQLEGENGMDFMTRLGEYKVVQTLWARCKSSGQKPAKLLGRLSLRYALPEAVQVILSDAAASAANAKAPEEELRKFIAGFEATLSDQAMADVDGDAELVWATDTNASVRARQQRREEEASERIQRAADAETYQAELRSVIAQQLGESQTTVEEIDGE